jgi:Leu/Phe-tRNA-protein transferase
MTKEAALHSSNTAHRRRRNNDAVKRLAIEEFIPSYLRRFVHPYHGDFCFSRVYHPRLMAQLMSEGFLPIATRDVLLPKLHAHRCVISLDKGDLHISKSTRKKSKRFNITVNQAFSKVVEGCHQQHGEKCWLYPPLVEVFENMNQAGHIPAVVLESGDQKAQVSPVRMYSIEVWNAETGALAGGELGYTVGSIYTSLTGFAAEDSAGSVQLAALGKLLTQLGFSMWDLGMEMDYKNSLGCHLMPRTEFVAHVHNVRHAKGHLVLPTGSTKYNAKNVIDQTIPELQSKEKDNDSPASASRPNPPSLPNSATVQQHISPPPAQDPQRIKRHKAYNYEEEKKSDENILTLSGLS